MNPAKYLGYGFIMASNVILLTVTALWILNAYLSLWIGLSFFVFLFVPFSIYCIGILKMINEKKSAKTQVNRAKYFLMTLPGVGLACWFFDVLSTILVINVSQSGTELNPLGWPYSAPAALVYYVPILFLTYYLLYKNNRRISFYVATVVSAITLFMGARNFFACLNNFGPVIIAGSPVTNLEILTAWLATVLVVGFLSVGLVVLERNNLEIVNY